MSKKDLFTLAAMTMALGGTPDLYGGLQRTSKPTVTKCAECPKFHRGCRCNNGEMKPCSKYR